MSSADALATIRFRLSALPRATQEEIMSELADHLEDKAAALRAQGQSEDEARAAAGAHLGNPADIGARLADVHSRPTRLQTILAVLPFAMTGLLLPLLVLAILAVDRALGPMPQKFVRVVGLRLDHVETTVAFVVVVAGMFALFGIGALLALWRRLPLWSVAWAGSALLGVIGFMEAVLDEADEATTALGGAVLLLASLAGLIIVARWRGPLVAVLIALCNMLQSSLISAYSLSTPPLDRGAVGLALGVALALVSMLMVASVLHRWPGYATIAIVAGLLSTAPYVLQLTLTVDAATMAALLLYNIALPAVLLLLVPYLVGRRRPALT
jgi:hypothetical protein